MVAINWFGLAGIVVFYIMILVIGLLAARMKNRKKSGEGGTEDEEVMLAGRSIGLIVGGFTMTGKFSFFHSFLSFGNFLFFFHFFTLLTIEALQLSCSSRT